MQLRGVAGGVCGRWDVGVWQVGVDVTVLSTCHLRVSKRISLFGVSFMYQACKRHLPISF